MSEPTSQTRSWFRSFALLVLAGAAARCGGLKLQLVAASVRKPSNVAVYFTVDTTSGEPVADLEPNDFHIYEDGKPVSTLESQQTILQQEIAAVHDTLLLVDMSGSVVGSGDMPALMSAAASFADRVGPYQKVAIYTFDGSPHITAVVPFGGNVRAGVDKRELSDSGRSGMFASQNRADIARGVDEVANRIEAASRRFYLLSYCSPSRAGEHDVEVEAVARGKRGRLAHHFNAAGFGPRCGPNQRPAFDVRHPRVRGPESDNAPAPPGGR